MKTLFGNKTNTPPRAGKRECAWDCVAPVRAFSLVELLVVILVLALLIALLLPAILGVRDRARSAICVSNLRQLGAATSMYVGENQGRYPEMAGSGDSSEPDTMKRNAYGLQWDVQLMPYLGYSTNPTSYYASTSTKPTVFYCPAAHHYYPEEPRLSLSYAFNRKLTLRNDPVYDSLNQAFLVPSPRNTILITELDVSPTVARVGANTGLFLFGGRNNVIFSGSGPGWTSRIDFTRHRTGKVAILFADYSVGWRPPSSTNPQFGPPEDSSF